MEVLWNTAVLGTIIGHYANIWVGKAEGITDVSSNNLHAVHITPLHPFEKVSIETIYAVTLINCLG